MDIYKISSMGELLKDNPYPGRGIVAGRSRDGKKAVAAYFIMGRSANSRNRVFRERGEELYTEPFDASKLEDPSLIIYRAVAKLPDMLIVTNGDQTDTIAEGFKEGHCYRHSLMARSFEPDSPNFTPRISAVLNFWNEGDKAVKYTDFDYHMSILKSIDAEGTGCARFSLDYPSRPGLGHFLHTYMTDGNPLPTFTGEPERIAVPDDIDAFAEEIWVNLNEENKISLYLSYVDLATGEAEKRVINKLQGE